MRHKAAETHERTCGKRWEEVILGERERKPGKGKKEEEGHIMIRRVDFFHPCYPWALSPPTTYLILAILS
jgi:hypothetical protein